MAKLKGSRYVEVEPGVKLWVEDVGEGHPVVFLHGWPASHRMFEYQFDQLPRHGIRCLGIDTRGFGWSDKPWHGYTYARLADDVGKVLDAFELEDVTLVGFSQGGAIATQYVAGNGRRVAQLVLMSASVPRIGVERGALEDIILFTSRDRPAMLTAFQKLFFYDREGLSLELRAWFHNICLAAAGHSTTACAELLRDADQSAELARIEVPTLILHGDKDKICLFENAEIAHARIPGSRLVAVDNAGHGLFYEKRDRINEELLGFVDQLQRGELSAARTSSTGSPRQNLE
jgi:non-heme chloroperoxidase